MKSVCIIGAGPAGLVAAKTFLQTKQFEVTVFEKKDRIGGIWASDKQSKDGFLPPYTPTNLSRFTVAFSDLDWRSVDYGNVDALPEQNGATEKTTLPMFPKAWMANRYLETYRKKYIPHGIVHCGQEVVKAVRKDTKWTITISDANGNQQSNEYDYLIMASGFFAKPRPLENDVPGLSADKSSLPVKVIHSSAFRQLDDLLPPDIDLSGKKILMLGGGNSSGETAAAVALQLSNAQWFPASASISRYKGCKIVHVTPRPIYAIPHFVEYEEGSRSYVPLDFKLYDFARRPSDLGSYAGMQTMDVRNIVHGFMQSVVGGDQSDISPSLAAPKGEKRGTAYVTLTESYPEYVRSGLVEIVPGRVRQIVDGGGGTVSATVTIDGEQTTLDDIVAVIYATGYTPLPALDMLDDETKAAIAYDRDSLRLPMILEQWQTSAKDVPNLSFLGFYEGPYWPMMEFQALLTAHRWLTGTTCDQRWYERREGLSALRYNMQQKSPAVPQFWFSDYVGYLEDIAEVLNLDRNHRRFGDREGCTSPARFLSPTTARSESDAVMDDLHTIWNDCILHGRFVARAVMRAFQGNWTISRKIQSTRGSFPSGSLEGNASFHPRIPSSQGYDLEYLYIESGDFTTSTGYTMPATRRYVYRYQEESDTLSVWFVKPDSPLEVDYLFHNLGFLKPAEAKKLGACVARADHLCVDDMYDTQYRLPMTGIALRDFEVTHTVKGPDKDYVATTMYSRPRK